MAESDNILMKLHDLLMYLIPQLSKFPRDQKFLMGDRIETKVLDVQECCVRAYYSREKRGHLLEANVELEITRAHGFPQRPVRKPTDRNLFSGCMNRRTNKATGQVPVAGATAPDPVSNAIPKGGPLENCNLIQRAFVFIPVPSIVRLLMLAVAFVMLVSPSRLCGHSSSGFSPVPA